MLVRRCVGKTNLDQFACGLNGTRSPYGAVPNAFNPAYVSGGSSSGSAYVVATGQVDFSLGTDTAGSGRVPAGPEQHRGPQAHQGPDQRARRGAGGAERGLRVDLRRTVGMAAQVLQAAMGHDPLDPVFAPAGAGRATPCRRRFRFGVPSALEFFGDALAEAAFDEAVGALRALGGTPVPIDYAPLAQAAALLYESALVAERYAAIRAFFDAHEGEVVEPVRSIIAKGRDYSAADLYEAQTAAARAGPAGGGDVARHRRAAGAHRAHALHIAQMQADPVALNRNLGAYTNFVNLLDYAAMSVPSSMRARWPAVRHHADRPLRQRLAAGRTGQRYHHATGLTQGATGEPLPAPQPIPRPRAPSTRSRWPWSARICPACRSTAS